MTVSTRPGASALPSTTSATAHTNALADPV